MNYFDILSLESSIATTRRMLDALKSAAGMAVAFPIGVVLALVIGTVLSFAQTPKGDPTLLFGSVAQKRQSSARGMGFQPWPARSWVSSTRI